MATKSPECGEDRSKVPLSLAETSLLLIRSCVWIRFDMLAVCCRSFEKIAGLKRGLGTRVTCATRGDVRDQFLEHG